jgi:hypothetical protein
MFFKPKNTLPASDLQSRWREGETGGSRDKNGHASLPGSSKFGDFQNKQIGIKMGVISS